MFIAMQRVSLNPAYAEGFEERFRNRPHRVDKFPGFIRNEVLRPTQAGQPYIALTHWQDRAGFDAWEADRVNHTRKNPLPAEAYLGSQLESYEVAAQRAKRPLLAGMVAVLARPEDNTDAEAAAHFRPFMELASEQPGFLYAELLQPPESDAPCHLLTYWGSQEDFASWAAESVLFSASEVEVYQVIQSSDFDSNSPR